MRVCLDTPVLRPIGFVPLDGCALVCSCLPAAAVPARAAFLCTGLASSSSLSERLTSWSAEVSSAWRAQQTGKHSSTRITSCPNTCWMELLAVSTAKQGEQGRGRGCNRAKRVARCCCCSGQAQVQRSRHRSHAPACLGSNSCLSWLRVRLDITALVLLCRRRFSSRWCSTVSCTAPVTNRNARQAQLKRGKQCLSARFGRRGGLPNSCVTKGVKVQKKTGR